jgi:hypothetical protein
MKSSKVLRLTTLDGFFDDVVVYLVALQGFVHSTEIYNRGSAVRWPMDDAAEIHAKQMQMSLTWAPTELMKVVCANQRPTFINFEIADQPIEPNAVLSLGAVEPLLFSFGQAMITNYYERYLDEVQGAYTKSSANWPSLWRFGRVVRNAMAHGGRIRIDKKNAAPVNWRSLSYAYEDNDRLVLHGDIWPGDLVYLLKEMDSARSGVAG